MEGNIMGNEAGAFKWFAFILLVWILAFAVPAWIPPWDPTPIQYTEAMANWKANNPTADAFTPSWP